MITSTLIKPFVHLAAWRKYKLELAVLIIAASVLLTSEFKKLDLLIYDWLITTNPASVAENVVIIAIDDKSIKKLGRWPWPRAIHGQLLERLSSANIAVVGFDILFIEPSSNTSQQDIPFATAIARNPPVVIAMAPANTKQSKMVELFPLPLLASNASAIGHTDIEVDVDGIVRKVYLYAGWQESRWPSLALALTQAKDSNHKQKWLNDDSSYGESWTRRHPMLIPFTGESGSVSHYSYSDILANKIDFAKLKDKVVLVGVTATGLGDQFATPFAFNHQYMSGVEINAHIVNGLLDEQGYYYIAPGYCRLIFITLLCLSLCYAFYFRTALTVFALTGLLALTFCISALLLYRFNLWFEPAFTLLTQILIFALSSMNKSKINDKKINELRHNLNHDAVTLLPNQKQMKKNIQHIIANNNSESAKFSIVIINIGKFKGVNDLLGFKAGDHLLNMVTDRINNCLDQIHQCARFNGPEFVLFFNHISSIASLAPYCENLYQSLKKSYQIGDSTFNLPISIGASFYPLDSSNLDHLFDAAVTAMHIAKAQPERGIYYYNHEVKSQIIEKNRLESDLSKALERNEIEVYYQPQVTAEHGNIIGVEALARWNHPERGLISPVEFIPIAEATGLIIPIGDWILRQSCLQAKTWHNAGYTNMRVAVNLSSVQFSQADIVERIEQALVNANLPAKFLELELTESCLMADMDSAINILRRLKEMGIQLSIDDFGTGYSSLSYLKNFPMDRIKIDRLFVSELQANTDVKEITLAIISMAHSLNMTVIAEGVESLEQQRFLNKSLCEELQGFYFSKPVPECELSDLLQQQFA